LFRALGDGTRAREYYEQSLTVSQRLAEQAPENADYARDLSVSYERMGDLFRALGDGTRAREYYEQSLTVRQRLAEQAPENADYARDLSVSYNRLGDLSRDLGESAEARKYYELDLEIAQQLAQRAPDNADWQRDVAVSHNKLLQFFAAQQDFEAAIPHLLEAWQTLEQLAARNALPQHTDAAWLEQLRKLVAELKVES
ncbi:MAG: tetratricopeptide repeat protein, partial [Planctomycetaceae bacterium]|nr:tetratricopeptide repeat protein [Planctomycetaceae bacterium]